jgi:hypothetical protein
MRQQINQFLDAGPLITKEQLSERPSFYASNLQHFLEDSLKLQEYELKRLREFSAVEKIELNPNFAESFARNVKDRCRDVLREGALRTVMRVLPERYFNTVGVQAGAGDIDRTIENKMSVLRQSLSMKVHLLQKLKEGELQLLD